MKFASQNQFIFSILILLSLSGCSQGEVEVESSSSHHKSITKEDEKSSSAEPNTQTIAKPGKITFGEESLVDFDIPISKNIENPDGSRTVEALGEINGGYAGFKADISANIDRVKISSLGKVSDNFLNELAKKYEHKSGSLSMNNEIEFVCTNMGKENEVQCMKLFYGTETEDASKYAELYLNIDYKKNVLEFHEKDSEYRDAVLKALTRI